MHDDIRANREKQIAKNRALKGRYIVRDYDNHFCFVIYDHGGTSWGKHDPEDCIKHDTYEEAEAFLNTSHPNWIKGKEICKIDSIGRVRKVKK